MAEGLSCLSISQSAGMPPASPSLSRGDGLAAVPGPWGAPGLGWGFEQGCVPALALPRSLLAPFLTCICLAESVLAVLAALPDLQAGSGIWR